MTERWLTVKQAAERAGFESDDPIRRAIKRGDLAAFKVCGRIKIAEEELDRFMRSEPAGPMPTVAPAPAAEKPAPARSGKSARRGAAGGGSFRDMARRAAS